VAATSLLEWGPPRNRDPEYGLKLTALRERLAEKGSQPAALFLGSSRVAMGIRPDALSPLRLADGHQPVVFNFALVGSGPLMELFCLKRLLANGVRPGWVIVECWPPFLWQEREHAEEARIDISRLGWSDLALLERYWRDPGRLWEDYTEARLVPWFSHRICLLSRFAPAWLPVGARQDGNWGTLDGWGWLPSKEMPDLDGSARRRGRELNRQFFSPILEHWEASVLSDRALRELVQLCRQQDIGVALLFMPETREFRSWYPPRVAAALDDYVARLGDRYGVAVIDARTWAREEEFNDTHHLNPRGAATFTARLGRQALRPFFEGRLRAGSVLGCGGHE
jgi:hypothetical protein